MPPSRAGEPFPGADQLPPALHMALACAAYNLQQWPASDELCELAAARMGVPASLGLPPGQDPATDPQAFRLGAVAAILAALRRLSQQPGVESLQQLAAALQAALPAASGRPGSGTASLQPPGQLQPLLPAQGPGPGQAATVPRDLLADASLALHGSARPLIDGVYCADDREAGTVAGLLAVCHAVWQAVELDDGVLRASVALKLGLLLEEGGELHAARDVLLQVSGVQCT